MDDATESVRHALEATEFENRVWIVGGAVRDALLGRPRSEEVDLVTDLDAAACARFLADNAGGTALATYPRFGTAMVRVRGTSFEIVTARSESYSPESRKPEVRPASLEEDASRRDFTVNALFRNLHTGELLDPTGTGLGDLEARILRTPREPAETFRDDPLRMLRAVRFRWTLGFEPAPELYDAIRAESSRLTIISGERIRDELVKMLALPDADRSMADLMGLGLFAVFAPELVRMVGVEQGEFHHLDVWEHSLLALRNAGPGDLTVSLAVLLHDIGKPETRTVEASGRTRFFGHETLGAKMAGEVLDRLRFPRRQIAAVQKLIRHHMRLGTTKTFSKPAARRLVRDLGPDLERLLRLVEADSKSRRPDLDKVDVAEVRGRVAEVLAESSAQQLDSPLSGAEIMRALGIAEGPVVGHWKKRLREEVLEGRIAPGDREAARAFLKGRAHEGR